MFLNSIDGLHTAVKQTNYYKSKGDKIKPILLDKVNFILNAIWLGNMHHWELSQFKPVPLHNKILRNMLGRYEAENIIKLLQEMDVIQVNHSYIIGKESKKYGLTDNAKTFKYIQVGILSGRMEKKILNYKNDLLNYYLKDKIIHSKIIHNLTKLSFNPATPKALTALNQNEKGTDKDKYYKSTYQALQEMNGYTSINQYIKCSNFYYTQSKKVNRVFHYFSTIPKPYRESLTLKDGTLLAEIDLKNSQPLIIGLNYLNGKAMHTTTDKMLLGDILEGNFYNRIAKHALNKGDLEMHNLYTSNYGKFKATVLGQGMYFNYVPLEAVKNAETYLMGVYPDFMKYLREKKRVNGYKSISIEAQQIEAGIFINDLFTRLDNNHFAVPVHDSIIVKSNDVNQFLIKLIDIFRSKFPLLSRQQVQNLFRITYY
jgi:hypothetical protein